MTTAAGEPICAVGIDFGTAKTGYAFAFKQNKSEIHIKMPGGQEASKTNTALLLDQQGNFVAFGSQALDAYFQDNNGGTDLLFERFKMGLDCSQGNVKTDATALNGKSLPLVVVITKTLEYVKAEALQEINRSQLIPLRLDDIQWVVTVPAIWSDIAKGVMRRAACKAGLIREESSSRLELVLEPEAACIACEAENPALQQGDTFMVLDCGGGTVDITMHRVMQKSPHLQLDEIRSPSGGPWGSTFIDAEFERFVEKLIGAECFRRFKPSSPWVEVMRAWEAVKLSFNPGELLSGDKIKAINMSGVMEVVEGSTLKQLADQYNATHGTSLSVRGKSVLLLPTDMIQAFFKPAITKCLHHVKELLEAHDVRFIFLVGGFAESKMLEHRVKNEFERDGRRVIVPLRPGLAVVRGAVMLGLGASERFTSRIAKRTYGVNCADTFDPQNPDHAGRRLFSYSDGGKVYTSVCDKFSEIVRHGARVALKQVHQGGMLIIRGDASAHITGCITIYASESASARWVTDPGMMRIGTVSYTAKGGDLVRVDLCFGATEISATVVNLTTDVVTPSIVAYDFSEVARDSAAAVAGAAVISSSGGGAGRAAAPSGGGGVVGRPARTGDGSGLDNTGESAGNKRSRSTVEDGAGAAGGHAHRRRVVRRLQGSDSD